MLFRIFLRFGRYPYQCLKMNLRNAGTIAKSGVFVVNVFSINVFNDFDNKCQIFLFLLVERNVLKYFYYQNLIFLRMLAKVIIFLSLDYDENWFLGFFNPLITNLKLFFPFDLMMESCSTWKISKCNRLAFITLQKRLI